MKLWTCMGYSNKEDTEEDFYRGIDFPILHVLREHYFRRQSDYSPR